MVKIGHFRNFEHKKVGHFEKKSRDQFQNEKTETEYVRFWGNSGKKNICHHVQNISSTLLEAFQETSRSTFLNFIKIFIDGIYSKLL